MKKALLWFLTVFPAAVPLPAQTWNPAGTPIVSRSTPDLVLLNGGTVLVVGGTYTTTPVAELFNPTANTFAATGSLTTARSTPAVAKLSDGRVLVAGGQDPTGTALASAEIYNPATQTWSTTGSMNTPRWGASAVLLPSGNVLVAGGFSFNGTYLNGGENALATSEVWNPSAGTWTVSKNSMANPHAMANAAMLSTHVIVAGGYYYYQGSEYGPTGGADLYTPATDTWTVINGMSANRSLAASAVLPNGSFLMVGGGPGGCCSGQSTAEEFSEASLTWTTVAPMSTGRLAMGASLIQSGTQLLVSGGYSCCSGPPPSSSVEYYDSVALVWKSTTSLPVAMDYHSQVTLQDGSALAVGGTSAYRFYPGAAPPPPPPPPPTVTTLTLVPTSYVTTTGSTGGQSVKAMDVEDE
jgi:hypothetical protein